MPSGTVDNASVRVLRILPFCYVGSIHILPLILEPRLLAVLLVGPRLKPGWAGSCVLDTGEFIFYCPWRQSWDLFDVCGFYVMNSPLIRCARSLAQGTSG